MSETAYKDDAKRIERDYVRPESTSPEEIEADLENADFANPDEVGEWILSDEDVGGAALDPHSEGVTTREQVESDVEQADGVGYSDNRREAVTDSIASEIGAPSESELRGAQARAIGNADTITPEGGSTPVSVVRGNNGEPVAAVGGGSSAGPAVAEEQGVPHYSSPQSFSDSMSAKPAPDGSKALLYTNDGTDAVGEVDL